MDQPDARVRHGPVASQLESEWKYSCCERRRQQGQPVEGESKGTMGEGEGH